MVVYAQRSQERLLGSGTDGLNMGFFYLIVDEFIREDPLQILSREKLA